MTTIYYRVVDAPPIDRLADSWKYLYRGNLSIDIEVERDHEGSDPHLVSFEMEKCLVLGLEHVSPFPITVSVKLFVPPMNHGRIRHNATAVIEYPRRKGSLEHFVD
jgi:hypothetical protein